MATFGNSCTERLPGIWTEDVTVMDIYNPASSVGTLTQACVHLKYAAGTGKIKVFRINGSNYDLIGSSSAQSLVVGENTFTGLSIPINPGDFIGFYGSTYGIALSSSDSYPNHYLKSHSGEVIGSTAISSWFEEFNLGSILATYTIIEYSDTYVNSSTGNDANAGDSCVSGHPVKTFQKAYDLLASNGTIHVCNSGADFSGETVTFTKGFSITVDGDGNCFLPKLS